MSYSITLIVFVHVDHQLSLVISILRRLALDNNGICRRLPMKSETNTVLALNAQGQAKVNYSQLTFIQVHI